MISRRSDHSNRTLAKSLPVDTILNSPLLPRAKPDETFGICGAKFRGHEWPICCYTLALLLIVVFLLLSGCADSQVGQREARAVARITGGGDANAGRTAIRTYGCANCHTIRGVEGARGLVGPPLNGLRDRMIIAGQLPNTPENLMHWIQHPHTVVPTTVMPEMNVTEDDSRDIAAYLYTLR